MDWVNCETCEEEFKVISSTETVIQFCPYCGSDVDLENGHEDDFDDWESGDIISF